MCSRFEYSSSPAVNPSVLVQQKIEIFELSKFRNFLFRASSLRGYKVYCNFFCVLCILRYPSNTPLTSFKSLSLALKAIGTSCARAEFKSRRIRENFSDDS